MSNLFINEHPLVQTKLALLRDKNTSGKDFRELVGEVAGLLCYDAVREFKTKNIDVETPLGMAQAKTLDKKIGVVALLRAGIGMSEGILNMIPAAKVGHIGLYRDPNTLMPIEYFCKIPKDAEDMHIFVLDPMLATGGTASAAISFLKERGVKDITYICMVCARDGVQKLQSEHPDVDIYTAAVDRSLTEDGFIVPGLGDVGNRMYGTK